MNEYLNHLKLMYQNVREIASNTFVLSDSRLPTQLYISGAFISDVSFVIVCPCNIVVVLHEIPARRDEVDVHIFRDSKLDKSFRGEYHLDTIFYQTLTYLVEYCPDLSAYDKLLSVHNLFFAKTKQDTLTVTFTATHIKIRGHVITSVTPEKNSSYNRYIVCSGVVYHKRFLFKTMISYAVIPLIMIIINHFL